MRVLVTGTRNVQDEAKARETIRYAFDRLWREPADVRMPAAPSNSTLIHGAARGIDELAEDEALRAGFKGIARFPAEWDYYQWMGAIMRDEGMKKSAGMARNREMLETLPPDIVLAFPGPGSKGTYGMVRLAEKAGIPTHIYTLD